jgi:RNA polymerase sigma-B factor
MSLELYRTTTSESVRQQILQQYLPLVAEVISFEALPDDEVLWQVGYEGLKNALEQFDPLTGAEFVDYARAQISLHLQDYQTPCPKSNAIPDTKSDRIRETSQNLLQCYQIQPTIALRNQIVQLNIGLVRKEAYHWINQCQESFEDLVQVGTIGLIRAIERFDSSRGVAFSSFAIPYIRGEIQHYLRDKSPAVRMPRSWLTIHQQATTLIRKLRAETGREPTELQICQALGISPQEWQEIKLACQNRQPVSLDSNVNDDEDNPTTLGDMLTDHRYRSFQLAQEDSLRMQQALEQLEERTRQVVEFVFLKEFTYKEVADALGVSVVTVSRRVKKGLEVLRKILTTPIE